MLQWREFLSRSGVEETEGIGKCVSRSANCDYDYDSTDAACAELWRIQDFADGVAR